jgi:ketosteroid isomerase-like protein
MSEENVEIARKGIDAINAFGRGGLTAEALAKATAELLDPQIEVNWHQTFPDFPQQVRGAAELIGFFEQFGGAWVDVVWEPLEFIEAPEDRVLTPIRQITRGRGSGIPIEIHFFDVWTIRDGKVRKAEIFRHRADALDAAGLSE